MSDDRVVSFPASAPAAATPEDRHVAEETAQGPQIHRDHGRVTMGVEVPADRRLVLTVQTIAQLVTIAREEGVPLEDGLVQGVERLAHQIRGAGFDLPVHLEDALAEIGYSLTPAEPEAAATDATDFGSVVRFPDGRLPAD